MKKIFIWSRWIDDVYLGTKPPVAQGGAELQMAFWAKLFAEEGFTVYTFSWRRNVSFRRINQVNFLWVPWVKKLGVLWLSVRYLYLFLIRPDYILIRSSNDFKRISLLKRYCKFRIIYMLAHDRDVEVPDKNLHFSWQNYLKFVDGIIAQNDYQISMLKQWTHIKDITAVKIANIFDNSIFNIKNEGKEYDFIWVGNIKKIKRINWFLSLAEALPMHSFAAIGSLQDNQEAKLLEKYVQKFSNLNYLGYLDVNSTTQIISKSRLLVCTSEKEGFPNTFLQAWSCGVPVISTVDPSNTIENYKLGRNVSSINELIDEAKQLIESEKEYLNIKSQIKEYFEVYHNKKSGLNIIKQLIN